jgi:hypothetical protein
MILTSIGKEEERRNLTKIKKIAFVNFKSG